MQAEATLHASHSPQPLNAFEKLIGQAPLFQDLLEQARLVAQADCRVLLIGEEGSGKETLAQAIHRYSFRHRSPFHKINCGEFRPNPTKHPLQLWYQDGTSQTSNHGEMSLDLTNGGTLYLHEVGSLTPEAQTWLLRCLLTLEMESLNKPACYRDEQIRIIAGTSRNLQDDVADHRFRAELFYRLNVVPLHIPPLRHRLDDIESLAYHFVRMYEGKYGKTIDRISEKTLGVLSQYSWPGNIEELEHLIERSIILSKGPTLHFEHIAQGPVNFPSHS